MNEDVIQSLEDLKGQFDQAALDVRNKYSGFFKPWDQDEDSAALEYESIAFKIGFAADTLQQGDTKNALSELTALKGQFEETVQYWEKAEKRFFKSWDGLEQNKIAEYTTNIEKLDIAIAPLLQNKYGSVAP